MSDDDVERQQAGEALGLDDFEVSHGVGQGEFESAHGRAFLLLRRAAEERLKVPSKPSRTLVGQAAAVKSELPPSRYLVFAIRKTDRSLISRFYSVGHTRNNDVVIRDVSVSKFHAFFQDDGRGGFVLQDARSTNGTYVNEVRVPRQGEGEPMPVRPGDVVRFGGVELSFVSAAELLHLIRTLTLQSP